MERGISLAIVPRNGSDLVNHDSGNPAQGQVATDKPRPKKPTNKYERSAMTAPQNKEPKTGSPISPMSRTMSKNS